MGLCLWLRDAGHTHTKACRPGSRRQHVGGQAASRNAGWWEKQSSPSPASTPLCSATWLFPEADSLISGSAWSPPRERLPEGRDSLLIHRVPPSCVVLSQVIHALPECTYTYCISFPWGGGNLAGLCHGQVLSLQFSLSQGKEWGQGNRGWTWQCPKAYLRHAGATASH